MINLKLLERSLGAGTGALSLLLLIFWLSVTSYRLYKSRNKRKYYVCVDYSHIRSEILYTLHTVQIRDISLIILILMEIIMVICLTFIIPVVGNIAVDHYSGASPYNKTFPECENNSANWVTSFFLYTYAHPINSVLYVCICMVIISQLMLISFLNSYLAARYFKHKLQKKFFIKYSVFWVIQFLILAITVTPQLQLFLLLTMPILLTANWVNLIYTSKKLCNHIKSKIKEIRLFESNPAALREHTTNLKHYRVAMGFLISSYLSFLVFILALIALLLMEIIIARNCYFQWVYGIIVNLPRSNQQIHHVLYGIMESSVLFFAFLYAALLFFPSLYLVVKYLMCWLYSCCTGRGSMSRMNNILFEPLLRNP